MTLSWTKWLAHTIPNFRSIATELLHERGHHEKRGLLPSRLVCSIARFLSAEVRLDDPRIPEGSSPFPQDVVPTSRI